MKFTLENLLTSPAAFGLTTATPVQRAICRVADGLPLGELAGCADVQAAIGDVSHMVGMAPLELYLLSGIRTAKSLLAAALSVRSALTCDVSRVRAGEPVRVSVLSLTRDLADVVLTHLVGTLTSRPMLKGLMVGEATSDGVTLRHPSGHEIEIVVVAGSRAGSSVVSRWSAGAIFDEFPRMSGEDDGVVNFSESRRAVLGRLLPGAQLVAIGSPWAPRGPAFEAVQEFWRKPSPSLVVVRAPATAMNPVWWTPARIAQVQASQNGDLIYKTDVLAEFADPASSLFASVEILRATRKGPVTVGYELGGQYSAAMDPATRGNAWTLVVVAHEDRGDGVSKRVRVVCARQWQGSRSAPLQPDLVLGEIATLLADYGLSEVWTDQLASDFVRDIAARHSLDVQVETTTAASKTEMFESLHARVADGGVELCDDPAIRADLLSIRKVITRNGIGIELPRTADGRHCDYAPALALAISKGGEGLPSWIGAMAQWREGEAGTSKQPPIGYATNNGARTEAYGNPPTFTRSMRATWMGRNDPTPRFTPTCTAAFRDGVAKLRVDHCL